MPLRDLRIVIVMFDIRNYRPGFELSAFVLSIAILLPNLIWYFIPAPTDLLRNNVSFTSPLGVASTVLRLLAMLTAILLINLESREPHFGVGSIIVLAFGGMYYVGWLLYYMSVAGYVAVVFVTLPAIVMLTTLAIDRSNLFSLLFCIAYGCVHAVCIVNGLIAMFG